MYKFYFIWFNIHFGCLSLQPDFSADVAKLADALDLGSSAERRVGSTPSIRTQSHRPFGFVGFCFLLKHFHANRLSSIRQTARENSNPIDKTGFGSNGKIRTQKN